MEYKCHECETCYYSRMKKCPECGADNLWLKLFAQALTMERIKRENENN